MRVRVAAVGTFKPRSPYFFADIHAALTRQGFETRIVTADNDKGKAHFTIDEHDLLVHAGPEDDNQPGEKWFFVWIKGAGGFVRVNAARLTKDCPISFVDQFKKSIEPMSDLNVLEQWPSRTCSSWGEFAEANALDATPVEFGDVICANECAIVDAVNFILGR